MQYNDQFCNRIGTMAQGFLLLVVPQIKGCRMVGSSPQPNNQRAIGRGLQPNQPEPLLPKAAKILAPDKKTRKSFLYEHTFDC
jgi:hypothetical protein